MESTKIAILKESCLLGLFTTSKETSGSGMLREERKTKAAVQRLFGSREALEMIFRSLGKKLQKSRSDSTQLSFADRPTGEERKKQKKAT